MRYNCSILDLYDRSIVATLNSDYINTELAKATLEKALMEEKPEKGLILHSDQGCQFTSWGFINYCESRGICQSMSKAGCPYDNAPMERFYNTLKNELIYPNPDKPEKLFLFSTPCVILKKKGVFICYSLINTLIKFMASLPVMTA